MHEQTVYVVAVVSLSEKWLFTFEFSRFVRALFCLRERNLRQSEHMALHSRIFQYFESIFKLALVGQRLSADLEEKYMLF